MTIFLETQEQKKFGEWKAECVNLKEINRL